MKNLKRALTVGAAVITLGFSAAIASADTIGVVDIEEIYSNYSKAQDFSSDMKVKEAQLQKFLTDAQKKLKDTSSPIERKNLEEKLTAEFKLKSDKYKDEQISRLKELEQSVFNTIECVSKSSKIDVVLAKQAVLFGGKDITADVLKTLNSK